MWDASKYAWSYTITQVAPEELAKPWSEQQHEILVTRSGLFKGSQLSWHPGCKEAYPPARANEVDSQFLQGKHPFLAAGDHRNITYIMNRLHRPKILKKTSHDRLDRQCLKWRHTDFQMYHVPGVMNLFNDFHSRAGAPNSEPFFTLADHAAKLEEKLATLQEEAGEGQSRAPVKPERSPSTASAAGADAHAREEACEGHSGAPSEAAGAPSTAPTSHASAHVRQHLLITEPMPQPTDRLDKHEKNLAGESLLPYLPPHDWPDVASIKASQQHIPERARRTLRSVDTAEPGIAVLTNADGKIVLPANDKQLIAAVCAAAHQGKHGHNTSKQMRKQIEECFWWPNMAADVKWWAEHCLQCIKLAGGDIMPRPMGYQLRATQPMEVVAMDFLDMPTSRKKWGFKAVLVIVDQLTRVCTCTPTKDKTAATAAKILVDRWLSFFPDPAFLITDGGTHFKCELFKSLAEIRGFQHHILAPYSQWGNAAERLNKQFLRAVKAILHTQKTDEADWPQWQPAIQECLNKQMPISSRDNRTPMELLTGLAPKSAIKHIAWLGVDAVTGADVSDEALRAPLADIHDAMRDLWSKAVVAQCKRAEGNRKQRRRGVIPRINVGDLVLVAQHVKQNKLQMTWTGPHQVLRAISPFVYHVRPMLRDHGNRRKHKTVHIVRIRRFSAGLLATAADRAAIEAEALRDYPDNVVKRFVGHTFGPAPERRMTLTVRWLGFDAAHDTQEPAANMVEDVPDMVEAYLRKNADDQLCARMLRRYFH